MSVIQIRTQSGIHIVDGINYIMAQQKKNGEEGKNPHYNVYCDDYDVFCDEANKGKVWLGLGITSTVLGIFAWCGILRELRKDSKGITIISMLLYAILCIISVIVYATAGDGISTCGEDACEFINTDDNGQPNNLGFDCDSSWGLSLVFMMIAGGFGLLSAIFTGLISYDDY
mmetsp:Transcript_38513/g.34077  ORF Transcript_38513/g.34077 Transcript_38513/m.34077 type:complete len:172 (+) Transcript_38513:175-690(+)